jgi:GNAT superfamily N-acetyltransferase
VPRRSQASRTPPPVTASSACKAMATASSSSSAAAEALVADSQASADGAGAASAGRVTTHLPIRSIHWRPGRGGRLRLGWVLSAGRPSMLDTYGRQPDFNAYMVESMLKKKGSAYGDFEMRCVKLHRVQMAIELFLGSAAHEAAALFQVHCLLVGGARVFVPHADFETADLSPNDLALLRAQRKNCLFGPSTPLMIKWCPAKAGGADEDRVQTVDTASGGIFDRAGRPVGPTDAEAVLPPLRTNRASIAAINFLSRRCLLLQLPACKQDFRDIVETELPSMHICVAREHWISAWCSVVPAGHDLVQLKAAPNRIWVLAFRMDLAWSPVGWLSILDQKADRYFVQEKHRSHGIGKALLLRAVRHCPTSILGPFNAKFRKMASFVPFKSKNADGLVHVRV